MAQRCSFATARLHVGEWHRSVDEMRRDGDLAQIVAEMMTSAVTGTLPAEWHGRFTRDRAEQWIAERDLEGSTLLARELISDQAVGLLILHEVEAGPRTGVDIRLGYLLAEAVWGRGFGGELVSGFVDWCRGQPEVRSLTGGVAKPNVASIRILERIGFLPVPEGDAAPGAELIYRLSLRAY